MKAALIGSGFIGPVHVEALRRIGVEVGGILDATPELAQKAASALGIEKVYDTLDKLLADGDTQSVHITSPNRYHFEQASAALDAGKHVICEKPLAMTSAQSAKLAAQAAASDLVAAVNYNLRFYPLCIEARERVRSGGLGKVMAITGSYVQDWLLYETDYNWRVLADEGGELRAVSDIGTHCLDLLGFITGEEIVSVMADLVTVHPVRKRPLGEVETFSGKGQNAPPATENIDITTEDFGTILLRFKNGARGSLTVSQVTAGRKNCLRFEIAGANHAMAFNSESPNALWMGYREKPNEVMLRDPSLLSEQAAAFANYPGGHNEGFPDTFKQHWTEIYRHIRAGRKPEAPLYATFDDGHRELLLCDAIAESNRLGQWVDVKEV